MLAKYDHLIDLLDEFESKIFANWAASVAEQCERNLKLPLLTRNAVNNELSLNFHPEVSCFIALNFIIYVIVNVIICCYLILNNQ